MDRSDSKHNNELVHIFRSSSDKAVYERQIINAVEGYCDIIIWVVNHNQEVTYYNNPFRDYLEKLSSTSQIAVFNENIILNYSGAEYWYSLYNKGLSGENYHDTIKLPDNRWIKLWIVPVGRENEKPAVVCWAIDVTREMDARLSLTKSEKEFRNIFKSLQDIFFRCKIDGELIMISPSVTKITGYSPEELKGKNITNYYLYSANTKSMLRSLVKNRKLKNIEIAIIHKSGKIIPSLCNINLVNTDNHWYVEGTMRDIAEIKQTNEELEHAIEFAEGSLKIKERFLANMSHEVRTPLNGIIGMVNVLERTSLTVEQSDQVEAIKQSSDILLKLLNNLLDWSKLEAGRMAVNLSPVSLSQVMKKIMLIYRQLSLDQKITISFNIDKKLPSYLLTDEVKIIQIISNLVSNALKFTPEGGTITVSISLLATLNHHIKLKCEVRDTGIGISDEEKAILFKSFTQIDSSENKKHRGAGLGLSISKELVSLLGGEVGLESAPGKGSNFWFTFKGEITEKKQEPISKIMRIEKFESSPMILVVDDNRINLEVATQILKNAGAKVMKAKSGSEALQLLQQHKFTLVLLDIQMPEMSGLEVFEWMKDNLEVLPPVIALTAYNSNAEKEKFLTHGFNGFVGKPISPEELLGKIQEFTSAQEQIIDNKVQEKLAYYGGIKMVEEAMNDFYEDTEKQIKECFVSLSYNNHKRILDILHAIKGNAGTLGVNKVARSARQIEEQLKKGYISRLEEELKDLEHFFHEFKAHYFEQS